MIPSDGELTPWGSPFSPWRALRFLVLLKGGPVCPVLPSLHLWHHLLSRKPFRTWLLPFHKATFMCLETPTLLALLGVCSYSLGAPPFPQFPFTVHASNRKSVDHEGWTKHVLQPRTALGFYEKLLIWEESHSLTFVLKATRPCLPVRRNM